MRVTQLWRFPVKSMGGESMLEAHVDDLGVEGDRGWSIFDVDTETTLTARRTPELLFASARIAGGELVMTLPDGAECGEDDDAALSTWLGRPVEIRSAGEHNMDAGGTYEAPLDVENDADWVSWQGPGGAFHDSKWSRVSLVSEATLGEWDIRRFRTNIVTDGSGEDDFVGAHVRVGDAELAVFKQIDRCVMVSRPQPGLDRDLGILKTINAERATFLSIGCLIAEPGRVALGDQVNVVG